VGANGLPQYGDAALGQMEGSVAASDTTQTLPQPRKMSAPFAGLQAGTHAALHVA